MLLLKVCSPSLFLCDSISFSLIFLTPSVLFFVSLCSVLGGFFGVVFPSAASLSRRLCRRTCPSAVGPQPLYLFLQNSLFLLRLGISSLSFLLPEAAVKLLAHFLQ